MIKYYCNKCKKEITHPYDPPSYEFEYDDGNGFRCSVDVSFTDFTTTTLVQYGKNGLRCDLCIDCCKEVLSKV